MPVLREFMPQAATSLRSVALLTVLTLGQMGLQFGFQILLARQFGTESDMDAFIAALTLPMVISGILAGVLSPRSGDIGWRIAFVLGIATAPFVSALVLPVDFITAPRIEAGYASIAIAGLLVGFGTRYGSGCTSGHGVCGLSRLSPRSLVATLTFMTFGFLMVYVIRHTI